MIRVGQSYLADILVEDECDVCDGVGCKKCKFTGVIKYSIECEIYFMENNLCIVSTDEDVDFIPGGKFYVFSSNTTSRICYEITVLRKIAHNAYECYVKVAKHLATKDSGEFNA